MKISPSLCDRHRSLLLLLVVGAAAGCDSQTSDNEQKQDGSLMSLASSLQSAVAACAETRASCEAAAGDAGTSNCGDAFDACRDTAKEAAKPDIDKAVNVCAEQAKTCREAATTSEAKAACTETLRTCLGDEQADAGPKPEKPVKADGGEDKVSTSPVVTCIVALHTCIEGDGPAQDCTDALRECIASTVGHNGGGKDGGTGMPDQPGNADAGKPADPGNPDAGKPVDPGNPDAGKPVDPGNPDAGKPSEPGKADAGMGDGTMSKACKDAYDACLAAGGTRDACGKAVKDCRMP